MIGDLSSTRQVATEFYKTLCTYLAHRMRDAQLGWPTMFSDVDVRVERSDPEGTLRLCE